MDIKSLNKVIKDSINRVESKYNFASVLIQNKKSALFISKTRENNTSSVPSEIGFVYKAFNGSFFEEVAISGLSKEKILKAEKILLDNFKEGGSLSMDPGQNITKDFYQDCEIDPTTIKSSDILDKAIENRLEIEKRVKDFSNITSALKYEIIEEVYINRNKELYQKLNRFTQVYYISKKVGTEVKETYGGHCKIGGYEHASINIISLNNTVNILEKSFGAPRVIPGNYECVVSPDVAGLIAHEAFGHGTESDMFLKERAKGAQYMGKRVASSIVNMTDSPNMNMNSSANASYFFDNDGTLATSTLIIKNGILNQSITDKYSSTKMNILTTSNSRVESYSHKAYARMTNTYFHPGQDDINEMISSLDYGFYISKGMNGMEDPKGWGMQVEAFCAEEVKNGEFTGKVFSPVLLTGYVPDILNSVSMISKDFSLATLGSCGKGEKEWVKVTDGGPYMKLKLTLA